MVNEEKIVDITIAIKGEYFDQIKAGTKTEEFRLCSPYWKKRLERYYDKLILTRGYPRRTDTEKRMEFKWQGAVIKTITHPHFGDDPVAVYAIPLTPNARHNRPMAPEY